MQRSHVTVHLPREIYCTNPPETHRYLMFSDGFHIDKTYTNFIEFVINSTSLKTQLMQDAIIHFNMRYIFD